MSKKIQIIGLILIFILIFIYFNSTMSAEYYKYFKGGIFSEEAAISEQVDIIIGGDIQKRIIKGDVIYGTFRILGDKYYGFEMFKADGIYQGTIYWEDDSGKYVEAGKIAAPKDLDSIWADLYELDDKYGADTFVAGPASNIEEGTNVVKNIFKK